MAGLLTYSVIERLPDDSDQRLVISDQFLLNPVSCLLFTDKTSGKSVVQ